MKFRTSLTPRTWRGLLYAGIFTAFFLCSLLTLDPDFGWHLMSGRYFIAHGIPATDIFTYTARAFPWIDHEWLADIAVAGLYGIGAYWLVALCYAGLWTTGLAIVGRQAHWTLIVSAAAAMLPFAGARTVALSVCGLALLVLLVRQGNQRWRLLIPPLLLVWANLHGSFPIGIVYLIYTAWRERSYQLVKLTSIAAVCTLLNPYGIGIYTEILRTMLDTSLKRTIDEWSAFAFPLASIPYSILWFSFLVYSCKTHWRRYLRFDVLLFVLAIGSMRMVPLFVIVSLPELSRRIREVGAPLPAMAHRLARRGGILLVVASLVLAAGSFALGALSPWSAYPWHLAAYMRDHPCRGNVFNSYDIGGFLIWQVPDQRVYIDGRMPSWEYAGGKYMTDYLRLYEDVQYRRQAFSELKIDCAVDYRASTLVRSLRKDDEWNVVARDGLFVLLTRSR
jgi:hypothetical protein